jgi:predicted nuclease of predicted toxin-antitoxin system
VKLLLDENLAPRLTGVLSDLYPGSVHVHQCGLGSADDAAIWDHARSNGFTIVSKDSDFAERSVLSGAPPKIIWVRASNCTSAEVERLLRAAFPLVKRFIQEDQETCLILGHREDNP